MFQDIKRGNSTYQIPFTGIPFGILGKKTVDCTHGVHHCMSTKKRVLEEKIKKVRVIVNFSPVRETF